MQDFYEREQDDDVLNWGVDAPRYRRGGTPPTSAWTIACVEAYCEGREVFLTNEEEARIQRQRDEYERVQSWIRDIRIVGEINMRARND